MTQLGSLKSVLPSVKVGVNVGKHHGGRFIGSRTIQELASPVIGPLRQTSGAGSGFQSGVISCPGQGIKYEEDRIFLSIPPHSPLVFGVKLCLRISHCHL